MVEILGMADPRPWETIVDVAVSLRFRRFHQCSPVATAWQSPLAWTLTQQCNMLITNVGSITFPKAEMRSRRPPEVRRALQPAPMCQILSECSSQRLSGAFVDNPVTRKRRKAYCKTYSLHSQLQDPRGRSRCIPTTL